MKFIARLLAISGLFLASHAAHAGASTIVRVRGSVDGFDKHSVTLRTQTGYRISLSRMAFPRWAHFEPGDRVTVQVPRIMILRAQRVN
jgi:hypothetical protein